MTMKNSNLMTWIFLVLFSVTVPGCGDGDPNAEGGPLPDAGLNNNAGDADDAESDGGVGFDDESLGTE